ncbi:AAA family ATPase [Ethanoligenens sp.]|uniref:AAA family ATPase n=1 Tax=Ethanoligenens sp. TaxID=2099655 RepID=UPI0039E8B0F6
MADVLRKPSGLISFDQIHAAAVQWLWYPYIPLGKLTLLQGDPGSGKTMLALKIASLVTQGGGFPGEEFNPSPSSGPAPVIFQSAEDGLADTIKPRLETMHPDFSKIYTIDESKTALTLSDERIEENLRAVRPRLFIIDPLQAYLGQGVDMHRANEIRPILARIARLADQYRCAFIFIMHMSKMANTKAMYRALGSIDIAAVARSMLTVGRHPEDPGTRVLCHEKSSLAEAGQSLCYQIDLEHGGVAFGAFCDLSSAEVLVDTNKKRNGGAALEQAKAFLQEHMTAGYAQASEVIREAERAGIKPRTLANARTVLGILSKRVGFGQKGTYWWYYDGHVLPDMESFVEIQDASLQTWADVSVHAGLSCRQALHP